MASLGKMVLRVLGSLAGIGTASIGGLPGIPRMDRYPPESLEWVPWGGSQLDEKAFEDSQEAFEQKNYQNAYNTLTKALEQEGLLAKIQTADERAQLYNNMAVLLANLGRFDEAYEYIEKAMHENPTIEEVIDALKNNRVIIKSHLSESEPTDST